MDLSSPSRVSQTNPTNAVATAFANARHAYESTPATRLPDAATRRATLDKLGAMLRENKAAIARAISDDFGNRSAHETELLEIFPALSAIADAKRHVKSWMKPKRSMASFWFMPATTEVRPQPLGVVGIIVPWNYPILLAVSPLAAALAAGNRALVKMSEFTPRTGALFAELVGKIFPLDQICVINGDADIARQFSALPFDHLLFTGSTAVGRHVMRAAAENLTPVTLELGGKSPAIVGPECDIDEAAAKIMFGKCLNAGQTCIAPDYVLLPRGMETKFIEAAKRSIASLYPTLASNPDYTSIVNEHHLDRLHNLLADAAAKGATITPISPANETLDNFGRGGQKLAPTIVHGVNEKMAIMQEEIFGPLLPLVSYDQLSDAIAYVNQHARPLALYYFGRDGSNTGRVLNETVAGGVTLNDTILHISQEHLPFGGVGPSGMGAYHGKVGFETFSKMKPVFHQARLNGLNLFKPPYGKRFEAMIKLLMK
jgi:coniferyl-aldehyde dehydrogenase